MHNKAHIVFIALIAFILILKFSGIGNSEHEQPRYKQPNLANKIKKEPIEIKTESLIKQPVKSKANKDIKKTQQIKYAFDDDPIVNIAIYSAKYGACYGITAMEKYQQNNPSNRYMVKWTPIQKQYIEQTKKTCSSIKEQFPEFETYIDTDPPHQRLNQAQSILAEYLDINKFDFTDDEAKDYLATVGQNYPDLIPNSLMRTRAFNKSIVIPNLKDLIQSENDQYIYRIESLAINLFACQQGANCNNTSQIMNSYCLIEENFCVDNFLILFNTRLSPGVKADVQLALGYIKTIYQQ